MYQKYLPKDLTGLGNSPGRSLFGLALEEMDMKNELYSVDYVEFYLIERFTDNLTKLGIDPSKLTTPESITKELVTRVQKEVATNPEIISFLLSATRPGVDSNLARQQILASINHYREELKLPLLSDSSEFVRCINHGL